MKIFIKTNHSSKSQKPNSPFLQLQAATVPTNRLLFLHDVGDHNAPLLAPVGEVVVAGAQEVEYSIAGDLARAKVKIRTGII